MGAAGTGLAFAPFVPWGTFLPNPSSAAAEKVPVVLPDGSQANVFTFPINHAEVITYPKTESLAKVVKKMPLDRRMVETDAPYLAPQIVRGKRNEPRFVHYVADRLAEIKNISFEEVEEKTTQNAINFFSLK